MSLVIIFKQFLLYCGFQTKWRKQNEYFNDHSIQFFMSDQSDPTRHYTGIMKSLTNNEIANLYNLGMYLVV